MGCKALSVIALSALCSTGMAAGPSAAEFFLSPQRLYSNAGYTYSDASTSSTQGGVDHVVDPDTDGWGASAGLIFDSNFSPYADPYIEVVHLEQDDRQFEMVGLGLRHSFALDNPDLVPFLAVGGGYLDLKWDESPVANASSESESGRSFGLTAQAGLEWYLLDNFALDIRARFDGYDVATTVVDGNRVTQLEDRSSASVLVGLVYRFGSGVSRQTVPAPVVLTTQCQPIFPQVPVDSEGCPLARFTLRLEYPAAEFSLASLLQRPDFNVVQFLKTYPDYRIVITGHTDDRGSAGYNQSLSERRVAGVQQYLKENGIDPARIQAKGRGESAPLTSNDTDIGRQQNRRIELEFVRTSAEQGE